MIGIDKAYENLLIFQRSFEEYRERDLSETDTRSKVLDKILIDVLGWDEIDIEREGYVNVGYFDYEIKTSNFKFVVEAKKNTVIFKLPTKGNEVKLKTILKSNEDVIKQIRQYVFERGLSYGVITNGTQFIIGKFFGENWEEKKCYYFKSIEDVKKNFTKFYDLLSKEMVSFNGIIKISDDVVTGKSLVRDLHLPYKNDELIRNQISNQLIPIINDVFAEIYNAGELRGYDLLKDCYVINDDVMKYKSELGTLFADEPPTFDKRIVPVKNTSSTHKQLNKQIIESVENLPDPIILIGTAGAGKTTFIKYFSEVILTQNEKKNRPIVYIDFRLFTSTTIRDTHYIYKKIITDLEDSYPDLNLTKINILKRIYKNDIDKNTEGIWAYAKNDISKLEELIGSFIAAKMDEPLVHLAKISSYLLYVCRKRICVIFDNADQLSDADQKEVFLLANAINRDLKCLVVTSIREGYFYKWRQKPPFNAYQSIVYHITAPPYLEVLKKRIDYVMKHFKFDEATIVTDNKTISFERGSLEHLFKNLYATLFKSTNSEIIEFLEEMSYPNTRKGLELFKNFLLSGHTKISEYMAFSYGRGEGIPIWEFFKSISLESDYYYQTSKSSILNIFNPIGSNTNHFTKIRLLNFLNCQHLKKSKKIEYVETTKVLELFSKAGYSKEIILGELQVLLEYHLISTSEYSEDIEETSTIDENSEIMISQIGLYYLKRLLTKYHYIEVIMQDTIIYDSKYFERLSTEFAVSDRHGNRDLKKRIQATQTFIEYLETQEMADFSFKENFDNDEIIFNITTTIKTHLLAEIRRIDKAIKTH